MASKSLRKVYFLCGMGRSGTHAIAAWLLPQITPFVQLDDMNASQEGRAECFSYEQYSNIQKLSVLDYDVIDVGNVSDYNWDTTDQIENVNYAKGGWIPFTDKHNVLIHVENVNPQWTGEKIKEYKDNGVEYKAIVLVRNPFNHMASLWHYITNPDHGVSKENKLRFQQLIKLWKRQTREALNTTTHIGDASDGNKVICIYDLWFSSIKFRKDLSDQLGVEWIDGGLD